ncbi:MAG: hypothetical protein OEW58_12720, partial [Gammaproteobacteria bacterium]|nr:hypothetical protein [Gammaproteobacteria bacterium]
MALALTLIASSLQASGLSPETTPEQSISNKTFASQTEPAVSHFNPIEPFNTGLYVIREQDKTQVNPGDALQYRS